GLTLAGHLAWLFEADRLDDVAVLEAGAPGGACLPVRHLLIDRLDRRLDLVGQAQSGDRRWRLRAEWHFLIEAPTIVPGQFKCDILAALRVLLRARHDQDDLLGPFFPQSPLLQLVGEPEGVQILDRPHVRRNWLVA